MTEHTAPSEGPAAEDQHPDEITIELDLHERDAVAGSEEARSVGEGGPAASLSDLQPLTAPKASADQEDILVIEAEDLADEPAPTMPGPLPPVTMPAVTQYGPLTGVEAKKAKRGMLAGGVVGSMLLQAMLAGAIGGVLAWAVNEPGVRAEELSGIPESDLSTILGEMAVFGLALGGLIGGALGAVESVTIGAWQRAIHGGLLGLAIGGMGGAMGSVVAQLAYSGLGGGRVGGPFLQQMLVRGFGWSLVGAFVGLGSGAMGWAPRKMVNGLLGGAAGGLVGGLLFDPIGLALGAFGGLVGTPSRFCGIIMMGMCTGLGIGLVEEIRKEAWLLITGGVLAGKQFILYRTTTWIGSAPGMDIPLMKDKTIAPKHCVLEGTGGAHVLRDMGTGRTLVNGRPVSVERLSDGDVIQIGQTLLCYRVRPVGAVGALC